MGAVPARCSEVLIQTERGGGGRGTGTVPKRLFPQIVGEQADFFYLK